LQIFMGDLHGLNTLEHQPQKIAAIEGVWTTERNVPLLLFAVPDEQIRGNHLAVGIPGLASLILKHDRNGEIKGLDEFKDARPPVAPLFYAFRVMVGLGVLMLLVSWLGTWAGRRAGWRASRLPRGLLWVLVGATFSGWIATVAGWWVTEIGRQPFIVYGVLRAADVVSNTPSAMIALSFSMYTATYLVLIVAYVSVLKYMAESPEALPPAIPSKLVPSHASALRSTVVSP
jgi:cytochrome bd ubiquinol oxidase subunit I